jgi:hypothetical protein
MCGFTPILRPLSAGRPAFALPAMSTATDVLRAKTAAELQFFVDNPSYYHADLVAAARQELHHRGFGPAPQPAAPDYPATSSYYADEPAAARQPGRLVALALGLAGVGGAIFWASRPAAPVAAQVRRPAPQLETVASYAMPSFDVDKLVETQLARVPAAEKQTPQTLRQFKGLTRRFWAAETQTEYLTAQAYAGKPNPSFAEQALMARETWRDWNKAVVYGYKLGPTMQAQYERMGKVASSQQHVLAKLPGMLDDKEFLTDKEMVARDNEVQDWLAGLRPASPVTGKPYRVTVLKFNQ